MQYLRVDHDPQRQLLQMRQLRYDERLRLAAQPGKGQGLRNQAQGLVKARGDSAKGTGFILVPFSVCGLGIDSMRRNKLFVAASSTVVLVFLGSLVLFLVRPIERSFAGTFPLFVGSAIVFSLPATPLLVWGIRSSKRNPESQPFLLKALLVGLALPLTLFVAGLCYSVFFSFRGR